MTRRIIVQIDGRELAVEVEPNPLGHRFWTFAGFPGDPVEPRPYGGSRGVPLALVRVGGLEAWVTAMELDGSARLWTPHELFPCPDQVGAGAFVEGWIARHLGQPELF